MIKMMGLKNPEGYRFTFFISFDFDSESAEIWNKVEDYVKLTRGKMGVEIIPCLLDLLEDLNLKVTFFTPSWVVEKYSSQVKEIVEAGCEVAAHGYLHEKLSKLNHYEEASIFEKTERIFSNILGFKPLGFRAPYWNMSKRTLKFLSNHEYLYDSSLMNSPKPYILSLSEDSGMLVELPVNWYWDDWPHYETLKRSAKMFREIVLEEIQAAAEINGYVSLTLHPQVESTPSRIKILKEILEEALKLEAWIPLGRELAEWILKITSPSGK
ncbi:MAG: polysaccharide deacetylase [Candidatus Methanomethylicota archaeon]|nr:MAG: polysaccharide deacetylase [Candidatus Verstraetearchaeota archaeon]